MNFLDTITNFFGYNAPQGEDGKQQPSPFFKAVTTPFQSVVTAPKPKASAPAATTSTKKTTPKITFKDIGQTAGSFAQMIPHSLASIALTALHTIDKKFVTELTPEQSSNPEIARFLFGKEPIRAIGPGGQGSKTTEFLKSKGFPVGIAGTLGYGIAGGAEILNTINPFSGTGKKLAEKLIAAKTEEQIFAHLTEAKIAEQFTVPEIKALAKADKAGVEEILTKKMNDLGVKERGFAKSVRTAEDTKPELASKIDETYEVKANKETLDEAKKLLAKDELAARRLLEETPTALSNTVGQLLIKRANEAGNFDDAVDLVQKMAAKATTSGQAIQSLSLYNKLTPEGILRYTEKVLDKAGVSNKFTPKLAEDLYTKAKKIETMAEGEDKVIETATLLKDISDQIPVGLWKKVSSIQTMMQLLNPKTIIRNLVGNTGFAGLEKATQALATPLDLITSAVTGKRTVSLPSLGTEAKSFAKGLRQGIREAAKGVNTTGITSQFELPRNTFKGGLLAAAEKGLSVVLGGPDRAFYQAAHDGSLYRQMKAAGVTKPTEAMQEIAHFDGLYATFQDENVITKIFTGLKHALNGFQDFGVGDFLLKYPKTPANLLSRGLAYSPAGFIKALFELSQPLVGKAFNQKKFVESTARAIVGTTGLIGTGAILHKLGIVTGDKEQDTDINTLQKTTGLGAYKVNVSALKRFVLGGFNPELAKLQEGDRLISYDWFQPAAIGISMGANFDESKGSTSSALSSGIDSIASGINTLAEQPLVSGIYNTVKNSQKFSDIPANIFTGVPASFVPTLLNQIRTLMDNTARSTIADSKIKEAIKVAQNKIPGLEKKLPPKIGPFGETSEVYQNGTNNVFNVFFNPAFATKYATTPEAKLVLDIFNQSGETKQAPRNLKQSYAPSTVKVNGENIKLKPNQTRYMQQYIGSTTRDMFKRLAVNQEFLALSDEDKANYMSTLMTNIGSAGKILILGDRPSRKPNKMVLDLLDNYTPLNDENSQVEANKSTGYADDLSNITISPKTPGVDIDPPNFIQKITNAIADNVPFLQSKTGKQLKQLAIDNYPFTDKAIKDIEKHTELSYTPMNQGAEGGEELPFRNIDYVPGGLALIKLLDKKGIQLPEGVMRTLLTARDKGRANVQINIAGTGIIAHELFHAVATKEGFDTKAFNEAWDSIKGNKYTKTVDSHIRKYSDLYDTNDEDSLANERFAYLGETRGVGGLDEIPEELRPFYESILKKSNETTDKK